MTTARPIKMTTTRQIIVAYTPNGRAIYRHADGKFSVQPCNTNRWIFFDTLEDARNGYWWSWVY